MLQVSGVGENKFGRYGESFLKIIQEYTGGVHEKFYFGEPEDFYPNAGNGRGRSRIPGGRKEGFYLTEVQAISFPYAEKYLVTEIAEKLNDLRDTEKVRKTSGAEIFRKLQAEGYVSEQYIDGTRKKVVSEKGKEAGLFIDMRMSKKGTEYEDVYYNEKAQEMIVNMLTRPYF